MYRYECDHGGSGGDVPLIVCGTKSEITAFKITRSPNIENMIRAINVDSWYACCAWWW